MTRAPRGPRGGYVLAVSPCGLIRWRIAAMRALASPDLRLDDGKHATIANDSDRWLSP
jgi:hypothetical protein